MWCHYRHPSHKDALWGSYGSLSPQSPQTMPKYLIRWRVVPFRRYGALWCQHLTMWETRRKRAEKFANIGTTSTTKFSTDTTFHVENYSCSNKGLRTATPT